MNQNPSLTASKNLTIDRIYTNTEKQYYVNFLINKVLFRKGE